MNIDLDSITNHCVYHYDTQLCYYYYYYLYYDLIINNYMAHLKQ